MDKKMEEYLKNVALPEHESPGHRQELRHKLLDEMKRRHQMATKRNLRRLIYVIAVLVGLSALALAGTKYVRKWYFVEEKDGVYTFRTEPEEIASVDISPTHSIGVFNATTVIMGSSESKEQAEKDLMEMEQLKAAGKRELLKVIEKEMDNGETIKIHRYKYVLSDGREITMAEGSHDDRSPQEVRADLEQRKKEYEENLLRAKEEGKREIAEAFEVEIDGKVFSAYHIFYSMPDESKVEASEGSTEEAIRVAVGQEYDQLAKKMSEETADEVLPAEERGIEGQKFTFTRRMIRLQDGREVIYSHGKPSEDN